MKKKRKENRMKRRALKAEINHLHREIFRLTHPPMGIEHRLHPQTYRIEQLVPYTEVMNIGESLEYHKNAMLFKMFKELAENKVISYSVTDSSGTGAMKLTMEITVVRHE